MSLIILIKMVFYFYSNLPITDRSSIVCPLTRKDKLSTVKLRHGTSLNIHSLFVPIGKVAYPANVLAHSTYVKAETYGGGYRALAAGTITVKRSRTYFAVKAKDNVSIDIARGDITTNMAIRKIPNDIVMGSGYTWSDIAEPTLYLDSSDNKWKYKKLLWMDTVKTITYSDAKVPAVSNDTVVFDFQQLKVIANDSLYPLLDLNKIYYVTADGELRSTETNAFYKDNGKTYLQKLVTNNPSYVFKSATDMTTNTSNSDGIVLSVDGKSIVVYNDASLFCIYPQKAFIMGQKIWRDSFIETPMTLGEWGWLSQKYKTVYGEMKALRDKFWPVMK